MNEPTPPWRHRRVWLDPQSLCELAVHWQAEPQALDSLAQWVGEGRPVVGRAWGHEESDQTAGRAPLGLALPPLARKRRLAFAVSRSAILRTEPALPLEEALDGLPPAHRLAAAQVLAGARDLGVAVRVYGSAFWSHALGEAAMRDDSDLDLLFVSPSRAATRALLAALQRWEHELPVRLDGELLLGDGSAVAWRELAAAPDTLLIKTDQGPLLRSTAEVFSQYWPA